ncbi:hypothetical protein SGUI_2279 [Serinicoccus hydrothermalis]|uniref:N-acetyltransferase domain-containing protein n=1 Tax=Serinicoccus hydrothermalis TaxID=1758689 RepID=A0A1B1NE95_9MICO|nr:hypothetical protein [Serinicoccus hydrothermalis]ANS79675.1 hypothetical protein SGUI_2279 [Serinicoccus hydrothermalis]
MRTRDFSQAPPVAQASAMLTVAPASGRASPRWLARAARAVRRAEGLVRREWLLDGARPAGVVAWFATPEQARAARHTLQRAVGECDVQEHHAHPDGYSNGVWRAEDHLMRHIERFTPVGAEEVGPTVVRARDGRRSRPTTNSLAPRFLAGPHLAAAGESPKRGEVEEMRVEPVRTSADLRGFLKVHPWGTRRETHGVPLWHSTIRSWFTGRGPHRQHGPVELFVVRDPWGAVAGRTTLHTDARMDEKLGEPTLLMGATEFAGEAALAALVRYAEEQARQRGRTRLLGPVSLLPNQVGGVVTSGWDEPGFLDGPWSPRHYSRDWEALGFERVWEGSTWLCPDLGSLDPAEVFPVGPLPEGVVLRHADRKRLDEQLPLLRQMLNASFAELGYYTHIEADELAAATDGLAHLLDERLLLWLEQDGEPVAFVLVVPDLTAFVRSTGGRLGPVDMLRLLATRGLYRRDAVLIIKGTVPGARGRGLMRHLSRELLEGLQTGGYASLRVTFVEHDNAGSQAQFVAMGGAPLHGTCFYTRAVGAAEGGGEGEGKDEGVDAGAGGAVREAEPPGTPAVRERALPGSPAARLLARSADWGRAPSAHNTQPWDVRATGDDTLLLGWHAERELPVADATRRDLLLSLGACAASLQVVAADLGLRAEVDWAVDLDARQAAVLRLTQDSASGQTDASTDEPRGRPQPGSRLPWTVAELRARTTVRAPYPEAPGAAEVAEIARLAGLGEGTGLLVLPEDLVDRLLPGATAQTLTGAPATELAGWLRLSERHPRHDLDGLSAQALGLGRAEAAGLGLLTGSRGMRSALARTRLDRLVARASEARPRGAVLVLWAAPGLSPEELGPLGGSLLGAWLGGERRGWSAHPLSELLDEPSSAAAVDAHVSGVLGSPAQAYAVWRCGRPAEPWAYRSPRLTD